MVMHLSNQLSARFLWSKTQEAGRLTGHGRVAVRAGFDGVVGGRDGGGGGGDIVDCVDGGRESFFGRGVFGVFVRDQREEVGWEGNAGVCWRRHFGCLS